LWHILRCCRFFGYGLGGLPLVITISL